MDIISIMSIFRVGRGRSKGDSSIFLCTKTRPEEKPPGKNIRRADMKQNSSTEKRKNRGFTLVELIVVIAILAILSAVGAVAYTGYIEYTKKGLDKQTVGEIMHALELADYADSSLFGENGGAMVVISTKNTDAAGLNDENTAALKNALEDALGEGGLASTKLSYGKWSGTANMNVFAGLGNSGSQVETYINNLKDPTKGVSAAFAEDFEQYWGAFENLVKAINESGSVEGIEGSNKFFEEQKDKIIETLVERYSDSTIKGNTINNWGNFSVDNSELMNADLRLAQNYSFISYLKRQNLTPEAREVVENYLVEHPYNLGINLLELDDDWCPATLKTELSGYVTSYKNTQAEADAIAYLGLMEAAGQVRENLIAEKGAGGYTDNDFLSALNPYVGMVSNVLTGKTDLNAIKTLATNRDGSVVIISATKRNGVLSFSVSPEEADPRDGSTESVKTYTTKVEIPDEEFKAGYTAALNLSSSDGKNKKGTVSYTASGNTSLVSSESDKVNVTVNGSQITVDALAAGDTVITLKTETRSGSLEWTINVHID